MLRRVKPTSPTSSRYDRVVLTGFMGSGKSTVGRILADRLGWCFADLDEAVAAREAMSVPEIFAAKGEAAFRLAETEVLEGLLQSPQMVVALGGGAPETPALRLLLSGAPATAVIHLQAPFSVLYNRCLAQAQDPAAIPRPLLGERDAAEQRYARRLDLYTSVAHHVAAADAVSPDEIASQILSFLDDAFSPG